MTHQEQNAALLARYQAGDRQALAELIEANEPLIRNITRKQCKVQPHSLLYDDCIQEGRMALVVAADRYDATKSQFSTYASLWVYARVRRYSLEHAGIIRTPTQSPKYLRSSVLLARESRAFGGFDSDQVLQAAPEREGKDEQIQWLAEHIAQLSEAQQRVILHDLGWENYTFTFSRQRQSQYRIKAVQRLKELAGVA
jgi:RNA polymerase sigma factor (sigma-70 family)